MTVDKLSISDTFYEIFSFTHNFGHSSQTEIDIVRSRLEQLELPDKDADVLQALHYIKKIALTIKKEYNDNLIKYEENRQKEKYIGGGEPLLIFLAREIFVGIIIIILAQAYGSRKQINKTDKNQIVQKLLKQMDDNNEEVTIEIKETYKVKKK